jgi:predicted Zn-dependent peptidase
MSQGLLTASGASSVPLSKINALVAQTQQQQAPAASVSQAEKLVKFKKLLDDGVLTQEEFEKKKVQLLGL